MKTYTLVVIAGDSRMNEFMHHADLFESFKALGEVLLYELDVTDEQPETLKAVIDKMMGAETVGMNVSAVFFPGIPEPRYIDPVVRVISTGSKWILLEDIIKAYDTKAQNKQHVVNPI